MKSVSTVRITGVGAELPADVVTTAEVEERAGLRERFGLEPGWLEHVTGVRTRRWHHRRCSRASSPRRRAGRPSSARAGPARGRHAHLRRHHARLPRACHGEPRRRCDGGAQRARLRPAQRLQQPGRRDRRGRLADPQRKAELVLVATGERASLAISWQARTMEELLEAVASLVVGDGGGAVVLESSNDPGRGLRAREFRSDPTQWRHAIGGRFRPGTQACEVCGGLLDRTFRCNGRNLFAAAFGLLSPTMETVMERTGWSYDDLDVIFCHQPTKRFVEKAIPFLGDVAGRPGSSGAPPSATGTRARPAWRSPCRRRRRPDAGRGGEGTGAGPSSGVSAAAMTMVW